MFRIHFIIVMIRWTGLAPREFEFPFPGSLTSTFPGAGERHAHAAAETDLDREHVDAAALLVRIHFIILMIRWTGLGAGVRHAHAAAETDVNREHVYPEEENNFFTEMCSGSEEGSYLRLIDFRITQEEEAEEEEKGETCTCGGGDRCRSGACARGTASVV